MRFLIILTTLFLVSASTCSVNFQGFNLDPSLKYFDISDFKSTAFNAPPTVGQTFTESLKLKISRESRLEFNDDNPDIRFSGTVSAFDVSSVSPERNDQNQFSALNRLAIRIAVNYENLSNEDDKWTQTFSHFQDFPSETNLLDIQDQLIEEIFDQIIEDIFNKAFTNW